MKRTFLKSLPLVTLTLMLINGCASTPTVSPYEPDKQLQALLEKHHIKRAEGITCQRSPQQHVDCHTLASELGKLAITYPQHRDINFIAALVYFQSGRIVDSQLLLDKVLSKQDSLPEAAILRSKIAMQEGNMNLARTLLNRQLQRVPDHPELYASLAATYYLEGRYEKSQHLLQTADRLGAPAWRSSYHLALVHEAQQHWATACQYYVQTLNRLPTHSQSLSRLLALSEHQACHQAYSNL